MSEINEDVERTALASMHEAADSALREALGLATEWIADTFVSVAAQLPTTSTGINRTLGFGAGPVAEIETLVEIKNFYARAGVARYFIQCDPMACSGKLQEHLIAAGFERQRDWIILERGIAPPPEVATDLRVEKIGPEWGEVFGLIAAQAYNHGPGAAPWLARLTTQRGWHLYTSFAGDKAVGTGAFFEQDGVAWFDWGATRPDFRCLGSQGAIMRRRVVDAIALGCKHFVAATGEEMPGDPQHSYNNLLRMGFHEVYNRENYALPKTKVD